MELESIWMCSFLIRSQRQERFSMSTVWIKFFIILYNFFTVFLFRQFLIFLNLFRNLNRSGPQEIMEMKHVRKWIFSAKVWKKNKGGKHFCTGGWIGMLLTKKMSVRKETKENQDREESVIKELPFHFFVL